MAIYLGNTKVSGAGVQVDSALSDTSTRPVQNQVITEALEDVGYPAWQKPSDWVDIRSGALPDSVYYLVGHSSDYSTYPTFDVYATVSNSGTYDVYIDGIKKYSSVASDTTTTLTWQTLALDTGYDVTYPSALHTHIVRIVPTVSTNTFQRLGPNGASPNINHSGLLWLHTTLSYAIQGYRFAHNSNVLEAFTTSESSVKVSVGSAICVEATALKELPVIEASSGSTPAFSSSFLNCASLKKVILNNIATNGSGSCFKGCSNLKKIVCNNTKFGFGNSTFEGCAKLETLPPLKANPISSATDLFKGCISLNVPLLDLSGATGLTKLTWGGSSSSRLDGMKGLIVSNEAPFTGTSPQLSVAYSGLDRYALVNLFNSLPTVTDSQVCNVTGCTGAADLTAEDIALVNGKGWTLTR